jgi:hypothetical protein
MGAGYRLASDLDAPDGTVEHSSIHLSLELVAVLLPDAGRAGIDLHAGARVDRLAIEGLADPGATGFAGAATTLRVGGGASGWVRLAAPLRGVLSIGGAGAIRGATARDGDQTLDVSRGLVTESSIGLVVTL